MKDFVNEMTGIIQELNHQAYHASGDGTSMAIQPFEFTTNGEDWAVSFMDNPLFTSEDISIVDESKESIRDLILVEFNKFYHSLSKITPAIFS
jgi:hypothetical protein